MRKSTVRMVGIVGGKVRLEWRLTPAWYKRFAMMAKERDCSIPEAIRHTYMAGIHLMAQDARALHSRARRVRRQQARPLCRHSRAIP